MQPGILQKRYVYKDRGKGERRKGGSYHCVYTYRVVKSMSGNYNYGT